MLSLSFYNDGNRVLGQLTDESNNSITKELKLNRLGPEQEVSKSHIVCPVQCNGIS